MKSILAIAASVLTACAGTGTSAPGTSAPSPGSEADLRARYQQYRSGPPPYLDFESWKRMHGAPPDYTGAGS